MKEMNRNKIEILGLMSGTSLDGLDIAHVSFDFLSEETTFKLLHNQTFTYPAELVDKLKNACTFSVVDFLKLDKELGAYFAQCILQFIEENGIDKKQLSAIASHGHTIFHQPEQGFTSQIACGSTIAYRCGIPVINDFRSLDVIAGGQGAPLVPIGDFHLFKNEAAAFLNLGGFANISFEKGQHIQAFDVSPANLPSNILMEQLGKLFDENGAMARSGELNQTLLTQLNALSYYQNMAPKSLGTEWLNAEYMPLLSSELKTEDLLRTHTEHIAIQIARVLNDEHLPSVLITGGGAKNGFLLERISAHYPGKCIVPEKNIIDFKEALVFAFLGARYLRNESTNVPSVTGAEMSLCTGVLHLGQ
jgi:anhydro-N-acetylmuramic acid kinase